MLHPCAGHFMTGAALFSVFLVTVDGMAKPSHYSSTEEHHSLHPDTTLMQKQPDTTLTQKHHPESISLSEIADGAFRALAPLAPDLKAVKGSHWQTYLFLGVVVAALAVVFFVVLASRADKSLVVASAIATVLPGSRRASKMPDETYTVGNSPSSPPTATQVKTSGPLPQGWTRRRQVEKEEVPAEEDVTQFRRWNDPSPKKSVTESLQSPGDGVHFLNAPSFMPPTGVLASIKGKQDFRLPVLAGSASALGNPSPTPQYCEPPLVKNQGGNTRLSHIGVVGSHGA